MSFTIVRTNGTVLAVIPDGDLNTTSSPLFLPGRNYPGYGSVIDTNFVRTLENYAFTAPPQNALQGQLWFNTNNDSLCVCPVDGESDPNNWIRLVTNDSTLDITVANVYADHIFANGATFANTATANLFEADYLTVNVQANIGNLDVSGTTTLDSLTTANITTGSNTTPGNLTGAWSLDGTLSSNGNVTALGFKSDNYRYANGQLINFNAAAGNTGEIQFNTSGNLNSNPDLTFNTSTGLAVLGNITGVNFNTTSGGIYTGNGSGLSALAASNLTGTLSSAIQSNITQLGTLVNLTVTNNINTANVFATEVTATRLAGSLTTAAQPNITSVGTLTSLGVSGTVTAPAFTANTGIFTGNGSGLSAINGANVTGTVPSATIAGTVTSSAQANITSVGILTSLTVTGNLSAGNANLGNIAVANFFSGDGSLLTNIPIGTTLSNGTSNVSIPAINGNVAISSAGNANILVVTGTGANIAGTLNATGKIIGAQLQGDGGNIGNIQGSNVAGEVGFAAVSNSVAVANVVGIGNVALLNRDGNASNVLYGNGIFAPYPPIEDNYTNVNATSLLASFGSNNISTTGNITVGRVTASLVTGTLTTVAQPNITSLGTLTGLIVLGNINASNVSGSHFGNGAGLTNINGSNVSGTVANAAYATTAGSIASIPSGTKMLFAQTSAPTGWTKLTSNDNAALRVVSGTATSGGTVGFTTAFSATSVSGTTGSTALSESQMPIHYHLGATNINIGGTAAPFGSSTYLARETSIGGDTEYNLQATYSPADSLRTSAAGSGAGHDHTFSGSLNLAVKYVDVIIAQKD